MAKVNIRFHDESENTLSAYSMDGEWIDEKTIRLAERAVGFKPSCVAGGDICIDIEINRAQHFSEKAKRDKSKAMGLIRVNCETYYIDEIHL